MDYDRLASFLSTCTTPGFRQSLQSSPYQTLAICGFHPGEAALLAASLAKARGIRKGRGENELFKTTFDKIDTGSNAGAAFKDSWKP